MLNRSCYLHTSVQSIWRWYEFFSTQTRMEFNAAIHQDGESFTQWANRLRNLIRSCDYGNALDEQLRDRFAAGIRHAKVQMELRQKWPDGRKHDTGNTKVRFQEILQQATAKDPVLSKIKRFVDLGWPMQNDNVELKPYFEHREEISVECGIILWGNRMVIQTAQQRLITPHATTGKAPAELFLGRRLPTWLDRLKPDPRNKMEIKVWKQKVYHDANVRAHSSRQGDEVWVINKSKPGWHPDVVERRTGKLSYEVLSSGQIRRKHADQICSRSAATDDKPTPTVVNQQQEVKVQESQLPE
ncbi:hypothetical protein J437_LFUL006258 [Ladona fulva]|uniref:Uncharacterized protein n=1 Tax=Ladona fulva TaxID=123851 RepID=A0A8K0P242_LADFU|nr:hypothetical protein J437_LFUL006258 [Ladona fulva]